MSPAETVLADGIDADGRGPLLRSPTLDGTTRNAKSGRGALIRRR